MSPTDTRHDAPAAATLPATLRLGAVHLTVADLDRAVAWYQRALGLRVHAHDAAGAALGDGVEALVVLREDPHTRPAGRHAGLYHYALLHPSREELARAALRLAATRTPIQGASDHGTHEAIYLADADGNGIELAADRPREAWPTGLGYDRGPAPLDVEALLGTVRGEEPAERIGEGLRMGHLHLHVGDIAGGLAFYRDRLGLEEQANLGTAAFLAAGGYHHHLGINVWQGRGVGGRPEHTAGLDRWTIQLPTDADVAGVRARLDATEPIHGGFLARDPWGTPLAVVSTAATGLRATARVATERPSPSLLQLAEHFRHELDVRSDEREAVIPFAAGHVEARAGDGELVLTAFAQTPAELARVQEAAGSHLERFGRRDELRVVWT